MNYPTAALDSSSGESVGNATRYILCYHHGNGCHDSRQEANTIHSLATRQQRKICLVTVVRKGSFRNVVMSASEITELVFVQKWFLFFSGKVTFNMSFSSNQHFCKYITCDRHFLEIIVVFTQKQHYHIIILLIPVIISEASITTIEFTCIKMIIAHKQTSFPLVLCLFLRPSKVME